MVCAQGMVAAMIQGREPTDEDFEKLSMWLWQTCRGIDATTAYSAIVQSQAAGRGIVAWSSPYDAVLTPALAEPPVTIGTLDPDRDDPEATFRRAGHFTPYTAGLNISGQPAISVPLFQGDDGLPLAVQLIGRPLEEGALLALAAQLEAARPWADRRAPVA
jgi:amidase